MTENDRNLWNRFNEKRKKIIYYIIIIYYNFILYNNTYIIFLKEFNYKFYKNY